MRQTLRRRVATGFEDVGLILVVIALLPLVMMLIGAPFAAVAWLVSMLMRLF